MANLLSEFVETSPWCQPIIDSVKSDSKWKAVIYMPCSEQLIIDVLTSNPALINVESSTVEDHNIATCQEEIPLISYKGSPTASPVKKISSRPSWNNLAL